MGFKNPIVCKEVYLPFVYNEKLSFDEYKEKYGIDLHDYLIIDGSDNISAVRQKDYIKIFIAVDTNILEYGKIVEPLKFLYNETKQVIVIRQTDDRNGEISSALFISYSEGKFGIGEL